MFNLGSNRPEIAAQKWRSQLDRFVDEYETRLAALTWGLQQEWNNDDKILGIDLKPTPHFVACTKTDLEKLNHNTRRQLQEILGIVDGYHRETEIVIIAIGEGQVKLIHFQPQISPPDCYREISDDLDRLIEILESALNDYIQ